MIDGKWRRRDATHGINKASTGMMSNLCAVQEPGAREIQHSSTIVDEAS